MKTRIFMVIVAMMVCRVMMAGGIPHAFAGDVMIIANSSVPVDTLSQEEAKSIFIGKIVRWQNDDRITIVLNTNSDTHKAFIRKYIKRTESQFELVWRRNIFTGQGRIPTQKDGDVDVVSYVAQTRGAIGYINASETLKQGVKVLSR